MLTTAGQLMLHAALPEDVRPTGAINKGGLAKLLVDIGEKHPERYGELVGNIKDVGNHAAYYSGSSFSLDDLAPNTELRDQAFKNHAGDLKALADLARKNPDLRVHPEYLAKKIGVFSKIEGEVNAGMKSIIDRADNNVTKWVASGAKGDHAAARQMVAMSGLNVDVSNRLVPEIAKRSFSEGLSPVDFMVHANGARKGVVLTYTAVQAPGAFAKELNTVTSDMIVTENDCGTHKGRSVSDKDAVDRLLSNDVAGVGHRNDVVTARVIALATNKGMATLNVRSPLTCEAHDGVCGRCWGLNEFGMVPPVGEHVGLKSGAALTEPLTQLALNNKHAGGVVTAGKSPLERILQFMHAPKAFMGAATLSRTSGQVQSIKEAPSGGHFVHVDGVKHYIPPGLDLMVKAGQTVSKGDALSAGVPHPIEVVEHKGMDKGREYFADTLRNIYAEAGIKGKPQIFETVARAMLNHGQVVQSGNTDHVAGESIRWQHAQKAMHDQFSSNPGAAHENISLASSVGRVLAEDAGPFGIHQAITPGMQKALSSRGTSSVKVFTPNAFVAKPILTGSERMALQRGDWMSNLAFRFLTPTFKENAATGATSDIHGYNPYSAYAYGAEFGKGTGGRF